MPNIDLSFQGWIRGANIKTAYSPVNGNIDVSQMSQEELADKLNLGELYLSLEDCLNDNNKVEIELFDFE
jgi:hypothetical protein